MATRKATRKILSDQSGCRHVIYCWKTHNEYIQLTKNQIQAKEGLKRQLNFVGIIFPCSPMWRVIGWWHQDTCVKDISVKRHQTTFVVSWWSFAKKTLIWEAKFKRMDFMRIWYILAKACLEKNDFLYFVKQDPKRLTWCSLLVLEHWIVWPARQAPIQPQGKSILRPLHRPGGRGVDPTPDFQLIQMFPKALGIQNLRTALSPTVVVVSVGSLVNWRPSTTTAATPSINTNHIFTVFTSSVSNFLLKFIHFY